MALIGYLRWELICDARCGASEEVVQQLSPRAEMQQPFTRHGEITLQTKQEWFQYPSGMVMCEKCHLHIQEEIERMQSPGENIFNDK